MEQHYQGYYNLLSAAMVRGSLGGKFAKSDLFTKKLEDLRPEEISELIQCGLENKVNLHLLRRTIEDAHITRILAILRGIQPDNMLDIGKGNGVFMWRVMDEFRFLPMICIDVEGKYIQEVNAVQRGGLTNIRSKETDMYALEAFPNEQFDVLSCLDVLTASSDVEKAITEFCRITKRFIIFTFDAIKKGDNPKDFIDQELVRNAFRKQDVHQLKSEVSTNNRLIVIARK